ncbi:phytoene desaturase family protein [uncultured Friedmanniella sp.]|uniref:phytoene desaturase family protein n=1 Tax=uncultured Friedmanniella sp. TaxID=335381 RepID=UPI0035CC88BC
MSTALVIGGGIGGLGSAALLGKHGYEVTVLEKNALLGGRANYFEADGFRFDMGPSWYLMPDVFEHFFALLGERVEDHLELHRLDPSYRIAFRGTDLEVDMYSDLDRDVETFERLEPGSGQALRNYLESSAEQYAIAIDQFMYRNHDSFFDFIDRKTAVQGRQLHVFENMHKYIGRTFSTDAVQKILEYQLVFLGSSPYNTPALYNIMSHIDFNMGVFYPQGGIYSIIRALAAIGAKHGVTYRTEAAAAQILTDHGRASGVRLASGEELRADLVISNADMAHTETALLPEEARTYSARYWAKKTLAPSAFILYLGLEGRVPSLTHHNLAFGQDWKRSFGQIFDDPAWPDDPSYYVCAPSRTDPTTAPEGHENLFVLVPVAPGLSMTDADIVTYRRKALDLLAADFDVPDLESRIVFERTYTSRDFTADYNAYGGSALGLAHTMKQTAFRPNNISKKLSNLYYVGASTNPGIGMPICLISAELAYKRIIGDTSSGPLPV